MKKRVGIIVAFLVLFVALIRIWAATTVPYFSDDASYQNLRISSSATFSNEVQDPLSFGGHTQVINPVATSVLWLLNFGTNPFLGYKIILNFIAALHIALIFLIALRLSEKPLHALLVATLGACVPLHYLVTLNSVSIIPIALLFFLLALYYYIAQTQQPTKARFAICVVLFIVSALLHPLFLVFLIGLVIYHIYCIAIGLKTQPFERELLIASLLVSLVFNYAIYYKAFLAHGITAFWQSTLYVPYVTLAQIQPLLPQMGLILFAVAMYTLFRAFEERLSKHIFLIAGIMTASFIATVLKFIAADTGLLIISLCCVLLLVFFFDQIHAYVTQTKIQAHANQIVIAIWALFFVLSIIPTIIYTQDVLAQSTDAQLVDAYQWVDGVAERNALVVVPIANAHAAMYFAKQKTIMDSHVLLIKDPQSRADALQLLYTTPYPSTILTTLQPFGVTKTTPAYIFFSEKLNEPHLTTMQGYDNDCFAVVYNSSQTIVYKSQCEVREQ